MLASVTLSLPTTLRANSSRARCVSSGATTDANCLPRTLPTIFSAAGFSQRMMPLVSMT
jgi:hypothetical protein